MVMFSLKGLFILIFSMVMFSVGLALHEVDPTVIRISTVLIGLFFGPHFITGKIFEDEEQIDE